MRIFKIYEACLHPCMHIKFGLYIHILSYKNFGFFFFLKSKKFIEREKDQHFLSHMPKKTKVNHKSRHSLVFVYDNTFRSDD